jgi:hypothetical protein
VAADWRLPHAFAVSSRQSAETIAFFRPSCTSTGLRANIQGTGSIGLINISGNTFTGNTIGVDLATNDTASVNSASTTTRP